MKQSRLLIIYLCFLFSHPVFALRCGQALVDIGSDKDDVIPKCGEPESIETHIEIRGVTDRFGVRTSHHLPRLLLILDSNIIWKLKWWLMSGFIILAQDGFRNPYVLKMAG